LVSIDVPHHRLANRESAGGEVLGVFSMRWVGESLEGLKHLPFGTKRVMKTK